MASARSPYREPDSFHLLVGGEQSGSDQNTDGPLPPDEVKEQKDRLEQFRQLDVRIGRFPLRSPELDRVMCAAPDAAYDRTILMISSINVVAALMVSGVMGPALQPMHVASMAEEHQWCGNTFNLIIGVLLILLGCTTVFTTYITGMFASEPSETIHNCIAKMGGFVLFEYLTFGASHLIYVLFCLMIWIRCTKPWSIIIISVAWLLYGVMHQFFFGLISDAFPTAGATWAAPFAPWLVNAKLVDRAQRQAKVLFRQRQAIEQQAEPAAPQKRELPQPVRAEAGLEDKRAAELRLLVEAALPTLPPPRLATALRGLLEQDLTKDALVTAAAVPEGAQLLFAALDVPQAGLSVGERLRLAASISKQYGVGGH